jgi:DNA-binding NarL/FixJ family response regulator
MKQSPIKILCIEDNPEAASLINEELEERGYNVCLANNGQEGLSAILKNPPHLVLCDIMMPVMSGFDLLKKLISIAPRFEDMPFIFLTALGDRENEIYGRKMGADDYVIKPVDFEILDTIIKARLFRVARLAPYLQLINLSDREIEVLTWAASGKTSAEIAKILGISKRTIDFHIDNAREKLGVKNRTQAVIKATTNNLIKPYF